MTAANGNNEVKWVMKRKIVEFFRVMNMFDALYRLSLICSDTNYVFH